MVKGKVYALDAVCSHEGGPLECDVVYGLCTIIFNSIAAWKLREVNLSRNL
jgi:nitrite reductase/ring-hydroxylating ferredoxin subunit